MRNDDVKLTADRRSEYESRAEKMEGILPSSLCFESIIAWGVTDQAFYQIVEHYFCVRIVNEVSGKQYLYMPIGAYGEESLDRLMEQLFRQKEENVKYLLFCDVALEQLEYFKKLRRYRINIKTNGGYADYIYSVEDFKKSLQSPDSRYNRKYLIRNYSPTCRPITGDDISPCIDVVERAYCRYHDCQSCENGCLKKTIQTLLENDQDLNIKGILVTVGETYVGYAVGVVQRETFVFLFKKNCREYRGLNEYLHWKMAELFCTDVKYINYTEDMNLEGLRRYKERLAPFQLRPKYKVEVERRV